MYSLLFSVVYILTTVTFKLPRLVSSVELGEDARLACKPTNDSSVTARCVLPWIPVHACVVPSEIGAALNLDADELIQCL